MKKTKGTNVIIRDDFYGHQFYFLVNKDFYDFNCLVKKISKGNDNVDPFYLSDGMYYSSEYGNILWVKEFTNKISDFGVMCHEVYHMVQNVLQARGLKCNQETEEAYAYYFQNMISRLMGILFKKK